MIGGIPTSVFVILPIAGIVLYPVWLDYDQRQHQLIELARLTTTLFVTTAIAAGIGSILGSSSLSLATIALAGLVGTVLFMIGNLLRAAHELR